MNMTRDEQLLFKRFIDLSRQASSKGIVTFSGFLNLNELNIFNRVVKELYCGYELSGGYDFSERQMIAFIPDALSVFQFPIACLKIQPKNKKFADKLSHRDVLGSMMHLGVEREKIGDILLELPKESAFLAYVFCSESMKDFLKRELVQIRHTTVMLTDAESGAAQKIRPVTELKWGIIASNRLDCIVACMLKLSRKEASAMIQNGSVFIYNKQVTNTSATCRPEDLLSIRSFGRFRFHGITNETKKGRIKIEYEVYQ